MATQYLIYAVPIEIQPQARLVFSRAALHAGVSLQRAVGPLARKVADRTKFLPVQPGFLPTHLIVVDQTEYLAALDKRLAVAGTHREKHEWEFIDLNGITRQVLVAITLLGRCAWTLGGTHTFDNSESGFPYSSAGYAHRPSEAVSGLLRYADSPDWFLNIRAKALRTTCEKIDCYYRHGSWWVDRLSVALGYL